MFSRIVRVLPAARSVSQRCISRRNFWDLPHISSVRAAVRDMDRTVDRLQREFLNNTPLLSQISPRLIPIHGGDTEFRLNIDVEGYKPEEVSVNVSEKVLTIQGKMERIGEDGSKYQSEFTRQTTLPDNIVASALKSYLSPSGLLVIEAPLDIKANEIPIKHLGSTEGTTEKK